MKIVLDRDPALDDLLRASSVQFTRNPSGLSGALQKIGRYSYGSKLESNHAPDLCHMFFGNGLGDSLFGAMATHPPIPDRIHAIDPAWDGKFTSRSKRNKLKPSNAPPFRSLNTRARRCRKSSAPIFSAAKARDPSIEGLDRLQGGLGPIRPEHPRSPWYFAIQSPSSW